MPAIVKNLLTITNIPISPIGKTKASNLDSHSNLHSNSSTNDQDGQSTKKTIAFPFKFDTASSKLSSLNCLENMERLVFSSQIDSVQLTQMGLPARKGQ